MEVIYQGQSYKVDFPDNTKFFKLTREFYPNTKLKIGDQIVEIKNVLFRAEVRNGEFNYHHIILPKARGGEAIQSNLFKMDISRHNAWHLLFGNMTLYEVIQLLIRIFIIKEKQSNYGRECQQKIRGSWIHYNQKSKKH